jgi:Acetyltransferase (GNAT) domain
MTDLSIRNFSWREWSGIASDWERIHSLSTDASFFLSRAWVDCWLATFGEQLNPEVLEFAKDGNAVGCCLLVWRTQWVRGIPLRRVYMNCAGEDESDSTSIEFNSILSLPGFSQSVADALAIFLRNRRWDELLLPGFIGQDTATASLTNSAGSSEVQEIPAPFIDFNPLREKACDFIEVLGPKTRKHIRRTQRAYEETNGTCTARIARSVDESLEMLRQLAELHQARWKARGAAGSFSSQKFTLFHERLIRRAFDRTLLFRLQAGDKIVGLLYCFVYKGWVYHYQSGFCYTLDPRTSPGLLTLYQLIKLCLERKDLDGFDFMAGDSQYKWSLAPSSKYRLLRWITIRRQTVPSLLFMSLRGLKRRYVQVIRRSKPPSPPANAAESNPVPTAETDRMAERVGSKLHDCQSNYVAGKPRPLCLFRSA